MSSLYVIMPDNSLERFNAITVELDTALRRGGVPVQLDAGGGVAHQYRTNRFLDGWLLDNCPLNVILGNGWIDGQREALAQAGITPSCPQVTGSTTTGSPDAIPYQPSPQPKAIGPGNGSAPVPSNAFAPFTDGSCGDNAKRVGDYCVPSPGHPLYTGEPEQDIIEAEVLSVSPDNAGNVMPSMTPSSPGNGRTPYSAPVMVPQAQIDVQEASAVPGIDTTKALLVLLGIGFLLSRKK